MPGINLASMTRWVIILLQYGFVLVIYYFLYRLGILLYRDLSRCTDVPAPEQALAEGVAPQDAWLTVLEADEPSGLRPGVRFFLQETTTMGRSVKYNTIVIQEAFVSSEHALLQLYNNQYWLSDLSSTNGTVVNGQQIEDETPLKTGDQIKIGSVILRFER